MKIQKTIRMMPQIIYKIEELEVSKVFMDQVINALKGVRKADFSAFELHHKELADILLINNIIKPHPVYKDEFIPSTNAEKFIEEVENAV